MKYLFAASILAASTVSYAAVPAMTVYKDPNCGCCEEWVKHVNQVGFPTKVINSTDVTSVKTRLGVPAAFSSCHTAVLETSGQVIEGHVPAAAIQKLVAHRAVKGVAVPGMPTNSPGMGKLNGSLVTVDFQGKPFSQD